MQALSYPAEGAVPRQGGPLPEARGPCAERGGREATLYPNGLAPKG